MAILTWRNADAPNLAGAAQVIGENGERLSRSLFDMATGLGQFGQAQTERADTAALQAASQITDSAAYAQALNDGSILRNAGVNPNQVSSKVSQMLADRQNALLRNDFDRAQIENQQQDNQMALDKFEFEKAQAEKDALRTDYRFNREKIGDQREDQTYADNQAAQQLAYQISQMGTDAKGARAALDQAGVSDRIKQTVLKTLGLSTGGIIPGARSTNSMYSGADAVYGHGEHGAPETPLSQGSFGQAYDFGQSLIPLTRGKVGAGADKGTSAVGAYQFIGDTMESYAKKVFGDNWREVPFSFENQSKIAEALFNESKNGNLQAVWAGLPDNRPGAYKDMSFEEFQREVLPRESGMTLDEIRAQEAESKQAQLVNRVNESILRADAVDKGMAGNAAQRLGNIELDQFFKDSEDEDPDLTRAADAAIKKYPSLRGTDLNSVSKWLDRIQQKAAAAGTPLTAMQTTHVLGASMSPSSSISWHPFNGAESGLHFDEDKMEQVLAGVNQGDNLGRSIVSNQIKADRGVYSNATAALAQATKDAQALRDREAQGLPVAPEVRKNVQDALNKALTKHEALTKKFSDPNYQQKLTESAAEVARKEAAKKSKVAERFVPVPPNAAKGIGYAPATALTTGLPNQAISILEQRVGR